MHRSSAKMIEDFDVSPLQIIVEEQDGFPFGASDTKGKGKGKEKALEFLDDKPVSSLPAEESLDGNLHASPRTAKESSATAASRSRSAVGLQIRIPTISNCRHSVKRAEHKAMIHIAEKMGSFEERDSVRLKPGHFYFDWYRQWGYFRDESETRDFAFPLESPVNMPDATSPRRSEAMIYSPLYSGASFTGSSIFYPASTSFSINSGQPLLPSSPFPPDSPLFLDFKSLCTLPELGPQSRKAKAKFVKMGMTSITGISPQAVKRLDELFNSVSYFPAHTVDRILANKQERMLVFDIISIVEFARISLANPSTDGHTRAAKKFIYANDRSMAFNPNWRPKYITGWKTQFSQRNPTGMNCLLPLNIVITDLLETSQSYLVANDIELDKGAMFRAFYHLELYCRLFQASAQARLEEQLTCGNYDPAKIRFFHRYRPGQVNSIIIVSNWIEAMTEQIIDQCRFEGGEFLDELSHPEYSRPLALHYIHELIYSPLATRIFLIQTNAWQHRAIMMPAAAVEYADEERDRPKVWNKLGKKSCVMM